MQQHNDEMKVKTNDSLMITYYLFEQRPQRNTTRLATQLLLHKNVFECFPSLNENSRDHLYRIFL